MILFNQYEYAKLLENGKPKNHDKDHYPVVRLYTPDGTHIWLVTEIYDLDHAFGLFDLGQRFPQWDYVPIPQLAAFRDKLGLPVQRDLHFIPKYPISVYARAASFHSRIIEDGAILERFL